MVRTLQICTLAVVWCLMVTVAYGQDLATEGDPVVSAGAEAAIQNLSMKVGTEAESLSEAESPVVMASAAAKVDKSFEGFGFDDNGTENSGFRFIPPDPMGAAGKSRLIAVVNSMIEARTKGGHLSWREGLLDFYAPLQPQGFPFDPKIVYDQHEDRFVVVALELGISGSAISPGNVSRILLAVSSDHNPKDASEWYFHAVDAKDIIPGIVELWADYPGFEVDEEAVYVTANMFAFPPFQGYGGVRLWIVDKGAGTGGFYDGGTAGTTVHDPYASGSVPTTTMPAHVFGAAGAGPGIGTYLVSYSGLSDGLNEYLQVVRVNDPLGIPTFTHEYLNVGDIETLAGPLPDAPQAGSTHPIEVNDRRALDAVWRSDALWLTTTINPNSGPEAGETTAHWFVLNTSAVTSAASPPSLVTLDQQGDIGGEDIAPGTYTYFPAVAVNRDGTAGFGFSASAPTIYAGAYVTGRTAGDPDGAVRPSQTVHAGEAPYKRYFGGTRNRWGDYSGIAVDASNDDFFWVYNEFADETGTPGVGLFGPEDGRWGTAWGRAKFVGKSAKAKLALVEPAPRMFELMESYPNPFNPTTTVSFVLPEESRVTIAVYDVLGRQVELLTDGVLPAGEHAVRFQAGSLSSGLYLVRMTTPQGTTARTIQLAK